MGKAAVAASVVLGILGYFFYSGLWNIIVTPANLGLQVFAGLLFLFTIFMYIFAHAFLFMQWWE